MILLCSTDYICSVILTRMIQRRYNITEMSNVSLKPWDLIRVNWSADHEVSLIYCSSLNLWEESRCLSLQTSIHYSKYLETNATLHREPVQNSQQFRVALVSVQHGNEPGGCVL